MAFVAPSYIPVPAKELDTPSPRAKNRVTLAEEKSLAKGESPSKATITTWSLRVLAAYSQALNCAFRIGGVTHIVWRVAVHADGSPMRPIRTPPTETWKSPSWYVRPPQSPKQELKPI